MNTAKKVVKINHKSDQTEIVELYKRFFKENKRIYLLAGELNPQFYNRIIEKCYPLAKDSFINIICGPFISVEDDLFHKYYDIHKNRLGNWWYAKSRDEWWKVHPVFEKAYNNNNINIHVIKQRYEPHFLVGLDSNDTLVEDPHDELNEANATVHYGDADLSKKYFKIWQDIKEHKCYKWDKKTERRLFKPIQKIKRELELEEKLKREFSESASFSV